MQKKPDHVAIIMDGNRRWANKNNVPIKRGHEAGYYALKEIVKVAPSLEIKILTVYAFSTENWLRPKNQVLDIMSLMTTYIEQVIEELNANDVCFKVVGDLAAFPKNIAKKLRTGIDLTAGNKKMILNVALNYGGRDEIVRSVNKILAKGEKVDILSLDSNLDTGGQKDPDLIIRTGGELRLSNFLLWQLSYAELYFTDTLWPDFGPKELDKAILEYNKRKRRFGK